MLEQSSEIKTPMGGDVEQLIRDTAVAAAAWKRAREPNQAHEALDQRIRALAATDIDAETAASQVAARLGKLGSPRGTRSLALLTISAVLAGVILSTLLSLGIGALLFQQWRGSFAQQVQQDVLEEVRKTSQALPTTVPTAVPTATPAPTAAPSATTAPTTTPSATTQPTATPSAPPNPSAEQTSVPAAAATQQESTQTAVTPTAIAATATVKTTTTATVEATVKKTATPTP